jgi:hypothetical protein
METNNITINLTEVSEVLASKKLFEHYQLFNSEKTEEEIKDMIMFEGDDGVLYYKEEAQELFNDFYAEYWDLIKDLETMIYHESV